MQKEQITITEVDGVYRVSIDILYTDGMVSYESEPGTLSEALYDLAEQVRNR